MNSTKLRSLIKMFDEPYFHGATRAPAYRSETFV